MFMVVARGVSTMPHIDFIVGTFLGLRTGHVTFTLLGSNGIDESLLRLEVIAHDLGFIWSIPIFKDRSTLIDPCRVGNTTGIDRTAVHIHGNKLGSQFDILVIDLAVSIQMSETAFQEYD